MLYTREQRFAAPDTTLTGWDGDTGYGADAAIDAAERCASALLRTIEAEIIPRLMLAHRAPTAAVAPRQAELPTDAEQVAELTQIVLHRDAAAAQDYVQTRLALAPSLESLYLDLLAPVAQRLGAMWEADLCDFTQVTIGLWRLQQVVHEHSVAFDDPDAGSAGRRVLLMAAPGSQHTFGLLMVRDFFRRAGWHVTGDPTLSVPAATAALGRERYDVVGLSVGSECHADAVASAILALRRASLNPSVVVLVGGPVVCLDDDFVAKVGADATAPDAAGAVALADALVAQVAGPS